MEKFCIVPDATMSLFTAVILIISLENVLKTCSSSPVNRSVFAEPQVVFRKAIAHSAPPLPVTIYSKKPVQIPTNQQNLANESGRRKMIKLKTKVKRKHNSQSSPPPPLEQLNNGITITSKNKAINTTQVQRINSKPMTKVKAIIMPTNASKTGSSSGRAVNIHNVKGHFYAREFDSFDYNNNAEPKWSANIINKANKKRNFQSSPLISEAVPINSSVNAHVQKPSKYEQKKVLQLDPYYDNDYRHTVPTTPPSPNKFHMNSFNIMDLEEQETQHGYRGGYAGESIRVGVQQRGRARESIEMDPLISSTNPLPLSQSFMKRRQKNSRGGRVTQKQEADGNVHYADAELDGSRSTSTLDSASSTRSKGGHGESFNFKASSIDLFKSGHKIPSEGKVEVAEIVSPQYDSSNDNPRHLYGIHSHQELVHGGKSLGEVTSTATGDNHEHYVNAGNEEIVMEMGHQHQHGYQNGETHQQVKAVAAYPQQHYQHDNIASHGSNVNPSEIAGLVIVQMQSPPKGKAVALTGLNEQPEMSNYALANTQSKEKDNYYHYPSHNINGHNDATKVTSNTENHIQHIYNYSTIPAHLHNSVEEENSYRNIHHHNSHSTSEHGNNDHSKEEKEELEFEEGKITITKAILGSKHVFKGTVLVIIAAAIVTFVLAGLAAAKVHLSPIIYPIVLLPIALIAFLLFIPSIILFVPIVVAGIAGGKEIRRMDDLRALFGHGSSDWFFSASDIQRDLELLLRKIGPRQHHLHTKW